MDNYAIEVLEKEIYLLEKCLSEWQLNQYKEARNQRETKLNQLKEAIIKIKI